MSTITIRHACKKYADNIVIRDLSLNIKDGELFTLLGPSGCGKTTLLRMIAGFNSIEGGDFYFNDTRINTMQPFKRNIGMVFQNYAIFPHLNVRENVAFGLKQRKIPKAELAARTDEYLKLMQIENFSSRKPEELSGGQQQRVALARALVINPDVLLMDEPLSNLDAKLRLDMRRVIREIQRRVGITTVYVTHDQEEAMAISDTIAVMKDGDIQQIGSPKSLYHKPHNEFVATFIGRTNMISAELEQNSQPELVFSDGSRLLCPSLAHVKPQKVRVSIRPEHLSRSESGSIQAEILDSVYLGSNTDYFMKTPFAERIQVSEESSFEEDLHPGDSVRLAVTVDKINVFSEDGTQNLCEVS